MLQFLLLLSSSSSQGPFSQPYNLLLQPLNWGNNDSILTKEKLHLPCIRSEQCPLIVFVCPVTKADHQRCIAGVFPAPLSNPATQRNCSRPQGLGRLPLPKGSDREQVGGESRLPLTFLPPGIRLGLWLHECFFGSHTSLCNPHLISPSPPLAFMWYYNESHQGG